MEKWKMCKNDTMRGNYGRIIGELKCKHNFFSHNWDKILTANVLISTEWQLSKKIMLSTLPVVTQKML